MIISKNQLPLYCLSSLYAVPITNISAYLLDISLTSKAWFWKLLSTTNVSIWRYTASLRRPSALHTPLWSWSWTSFLFFQDKTICSSQADILATGTGGFPLAEATRIHFYGHSACKCPYIQFNSGKVRLTWLRWEPCSSTQIYSQVPPYLQVFIKSWE